MNSAVRIVGRPAPSEQGARREPTRWRYVALAILAALALLAFALAILEGGAREGVGSEIEQAGPMRVQQGLPVGYAHSREGAEAAAARFALLSFGVLDARVGAAPDTIAALYATPSYRATLTRLLQATQARSQAHAAQLAHAAIHRTVLATRLAAYTAQEASVETWECAIAIVGGPPLVTSQLVQSWQLRYEAGDWRIAAAGSVETPLEAMSEERRAQVLEDFTGRGDASAGY